MNRKSLANPLVENIRNLSGPLRRRSSIGIKTSAVGLIDNDDEAERARLRLESNNASIPSPTSSNRQSIGIASAVGAMSSPQIAEGIAECIKLNTQNKINMKNAFNLNMIDFMSYLVRNRDEGITNLQVAGTSLDVSAKIYALRVDVLHQDILKMAGNLDNKEKNDANNDDETDMNDAAVSNENESQNDEQQQKKKKKKRMTQKIRTTMEAIQGDVDVVCLAPVMFDEGDCQTSDMLYQAILPQHCGIGLGLHPYKDIILDDNSDETMTNTENELRTAWPAIQLDTNRDIITMHPNFEFLNWSSDQECDDDKLSSQETSSSIHDNQAFDLDASLPVEDEILNNFYDGNDESEDNIAGCHMETREAEVIVDLPKFIEKLPDKKLDYSFFGDSVNIRWMGPAHWKIKCSTKHLSSSKVMEACKQGAGRKKKEIKLIFDDANSNCDALLNVPKKSTAKLQAKTARISWSEKKLELLRENHENVMKKVCQFFLRPDDFINFTKNTDLNATTLSDDSGEYDYRNANDSINYYPNNENDGDDDVHPDVDTFNNYPHDSGTPPAGFVGDNLVEVPKLTQKISIPYSQRARKLDMRRLKNCIWSSLVSKNKDDKDKENINTVDEEKNENMLTMKGKIIFTDIVTDLPKIMNNSDAEELSFAIAFVSLLHLANEKCLKVLPENDLSDVIVAQDELYF